MLGIQEEEVYDIDLTQDNNLETTLNDVNMCSNDQLNKAFVDVEENSFNDSLNEKHKKQFSFNLNVLGSTSVLIEEPAENDTQKNNPFNSNIGPLIVDNSKKFLMQDTFDRNQWVNIKEN